MVLHARRSLEAYLAAGGLSRCWSPLRRSAGTRAVQTGLHISAAVSHIHVLAICCAPSQQHGGSECWQHWLCSQRMVTDGVIQNGSRRQQPWHALTSFFKLMLRAAIKRLSPLKCFVSNNCGFAGSKGCGLPRELPVLRWDIVLLAPSALSPSLQLQLVLPPAQGISTHVGKGRAISIHRVHKCQISSFWGSVLTRCQHFSSCFPDEINY